MKAAKAKHLSEIIVKNSYCSRAMFSTLDSVLNPPVQTFHLYHVKISSISYYSKPCLDPVLSNIQWSEFELVSVQTCREMNLKMKIHFFPSQCLVLFGSNGKTDLSTVGLGSLTPYQVHDARNLGFILDCELKLDKRMNATISEGYEPFLNSRKTFETVIHASISLRVNFRFTMACWPHLYIDFGWFKMQLPVCLRQSHISSYYTCLWLPLRYRIELKMLFFVYKALLTVHNPVRSVRSQTTHMLWVPGARLKSRGDRAFSVAAPKLWSTLPRSIRTCFFMICKVKIISLTPK
ncbi:Outer membrane protein P1 [Labeo rohita]|uniref:Outer membrane protein P1 n=1 Tax=Labeo rohita TaxID=84645 RepID=A0ABQ8L1B4_LABRO|nr:Outer membrane protein P1 [Labeo rohita]